MENSEPNKIVARLYKRFKALQADSAAIDYNYQEEQELKLQLQNITNVVGAIEVMSKAAILKLISMQSSLRFMQEHRFYRQFVKAAEILIDKKNS